MYRSRPHRCLGIHGLRDDPCSLRSSPGRRPRNAHGRAGVRRSQGRASCGFLCLILLALGPLSAADTLDWEPLHRDLHPAIGAERVVATYTLTNTGSDTVTITAVAVDCDCAGVEAEPLTVPPGGTSIIACAYDLGDRRGLQRQRVTVTVRDAEGEEHNQRLGLHIHIPEPIRPQRTVFFWRRQGPRMAQRLVVHLDDPEAYAVTGIEGLPAGFAAEVGEIDGQNQTVLLRPGSLEDEAVVRCHLLTTHPHERFARIPLVVMVR